MISLCFNNTLLIIIDDFYMLMYAMKDLSGQMFRTIQPTLLWTSTLCKYGMAFA